MGAKGAKVSSVRWGMDSPLIEKFLYQKEKDMCRPLAVRAEAAPSGLGNLRLRRAASATPPPRGAPQGRLRPMEPPLWVRGDRGRPGGQEVLTARWGCPALTGGAVHLQRTL
jgi:hypothetical protein